MNQYENQFKNYTERQEKWLSKYDKLGYKNDMCFDTSELDKYQDEEILENG